MSVSKRAAKNLQVRNDSEAGWNLGIDLCTAGLELDTD